MKAISREEFERLIQGARLLEADRRGPKVYETAEGAMVKLMSPKRLVSSDLLRPFAVRFARNAERLRELGVWCLRVSQVGRVPHLARQLVVYGKLPGCSLREALREAGGAGGAELMAGVGRFAARMHQRGVYFRSFHFGNVLIGPDRRFALIDILDVRFRRKPLRLGMRERNFRHMIRYAEDREALAAHWPAFRDGYVEASLGENERLGERALRGLLERQHAMLAAACGFIPGEKDGVRGAGSGESGRSAPGA